MEQEIKKIKLSNPKTNAKFIESIVPGSLVHFKIPKSIRSFLLNKGYKFTKSPGSKNSFFKAICLGRETANLRGYQNSFLLFVYLGKPMIVTYGWKKHGTMELQNIFEINEFKKSFPELKGTLAKAPGLFR